MKAREMLIRSRIYRLFAICFVVVGFVVFIFLYMKHIEGNVKEALTEVSTVLILLVPFVPAAVFSWVAHRSEVKFLRFFDELESKK